MLADDESERCAKCSGDEVHVRWERSPIDVVDLTPTRPSDGYLDLVTVLSDPRRTTRVAG